MAKLIERLRKLRSQAKSGWPERMRSVPVWLVFLAGTVVGAIVGLLAGASSKWAGGLIGLLGVVLGGAIASATNFALEQERRKTQIAMATWAERVRAHQEAYSWWHQLVDAADEEDADKRLCTIRKARDWLVHNGLYMSEQAQLGFSKACIAANSHQDLLKASPTEARANYETRIDSLPQVLRDGAGRHILDELLRAGSRP